MKLTKSKLIILVLATMLSISIIYNISAILFDYSNCRDVCGNYDSAFNTSGCFCSAENKTIKPMYTK